MDRVPLAFCILLAAFSALIAAALPVVLAVTAFVAALGLLDVVSHAIPVASTSTSVLVSGVTVMVAMAGMFLTGMHIFDGFALASILVVAIAMLGSVTVLPALLSMLGDRIDWGRRKSRRRRPARRAELGSAQARGARSGGAAGGWQRGSLGGRPAAVGGWTDGG